MYTSTLAFSYALDQPSFQNTRRMFLATLLFATGGVVGWPFALALAIPFVFEELFVFGADRVPRELWWSWAQRRWKHFFISSAAAALLFVRS
jgi:alpha-1,2-mannosyltransferase